jgi:hypothetical protein
MATFSKDQNVKFTRNAIISSNSTPVVTVLPLTINQPQVYVLENSYGWNPDASRAARYELDLTKKYLFVKESELTAV